MNATLTTSEKATAVNQLAKLVDGTAKWAEASPPDLILEVTAVRDRLNSDAHKNLVPLGRGYSWRHVGCIHGRVKTGRLGDATAILVERGLMVEVVPGSFRPVWVDQ